MKPARWTALARPTSLQKTSYLLLLFAVLCLVSYFFPVAPTISRSYVAGFNNRAALCLFLVGVGVFAWWTRGRVADPPLTGSRLSVRALLAGLALLVASFVALISRRAPLAESNSFLNRHQMLLSGRVPYKDFEFIYGPLLLYPAVWVQQIFHVSVIAAYFSVWILSWIVGVVMMWFVVRELDLTIPFRGAFFLVILLTQLIWASAGGMNYTPVRAYTAAFLVTVAYRLWTRTHLPWVFCLASIAAFAFALLISSEQAVAVACGLLAYMFLLALARAENFSFAAFAAAFAGILACTFVAWRVGLLRTFFDLASGGYSYPLLPSPSIAVALFAYLAAGCFLYRSILFRSLSSVAIPLGLSGYALLPVVFGRCDMLHITAATPAFVVGSAVLAGIFSMRVWWLVVLVLMLVVVPVEARHEGFKRMNQQRAASRALDPSAGLAPGGPVSVPYQFYVSPSNLTADQLPCDRTYFSPSFLPNPTKPFHPECLDTGYYEGMVDVTTPLAIEKKLAELRMHHGQLLLLENTSLASQFPVELADMQSLYYESASPWVPRPRNAPLTYAALQAYVEQNYRPGPVVSGGLLRVWLPISVRQ